MGPSSASSQYLEGREAGIFPPLIIDAEGIEICQDLATEMPPHTSCCHTAGTPTPNPDLTAGSPRPGGLCSKKMIVLVRCRMNIEAIHASAVKSFRRKTTGIQYLQVMNLSVNITH